MDLCSKDALKQRQRKRRWYAFLKNEFEYLYTIHHNRKFLSNEHTETLIHAFITSRLDYCNSLLYGLPDSTLCNLQSACVRLIYNCSKFHHITPFLKELHWLPVCQIINYKILLLTFKALHQLPPPHLSNLITVTKHGHALPILALHPKNLLVTLHLCCTYSLEQSTCWPLYLSQNWAIQVQTENPPF